MKLTRKVLALPPVFSTLRNWWDLSHQSIASVLGKIHTLTQL
jgi:hypothetical protein